MTPEVEICNLALSHIGEQAYITSIEPPEGSVHAELCGRFYPKARDMLLESHPWGFATRTQPLALLTETRPGWAFAYARPADALRVLAVLPADGSDTPRPYTVEASIGGAYPLVLTDEPDAVVRYVAHSPFPHTYPAMFSMALSWQMAALIAGPILKGVDGANMVKNCLQMLQMHLAQAKAADANQAHDRTAPLPGWLEARA